MLRRLIILWLIVSVLGYGLALAADVHQSEWTASDVAGAPTPDSPNQQPALDDLDCGHCSHGVYHLLGLTPSFDFAVLSLAHVTTGLGEHPALRPIPQAIHRPPIAA